MSLFYYINLVKYKKNFDSPRLLECLIIWNGESICLGTYIAKYMYLEKSK